MAMNGDEWLKQNISKLPVKSFLGNLLYLDLQTSIHFWLFAVLYRFYKGSLCINLGNL